jgi:class 3 adenylate cyclase/tetratricopeptide (TPR) repeat protein
MNCGACGTENRDAARFCDGCGAPLEARCPRCGAMARTGARFCDACGAALTSTAPSAPAASRAPAPSATDRIAAPASEDQVQQGERKTVTALFADIKGSTELEQDLDPEEARAIVDPALKLMIEAVQRYDGYVVQSTGDGIFAIFGAPVAHEDHSQRALYAAIRMQEELRRYSTRLVADGGNPLQCRVGVNTGEVVVRSISTGGGHAEYTPIGHTANLASRMQAVAPVGSIAVAEPTRNLCEGYFALRALGPTKVRGVSEPVNVYQVTGLGPLRTRLQRSAGRGLTKFVGREREMEAMRNAAELARAARGQIVAAMAEAGTGKSRLFFEFKVKNQSGWMVLEAFSVSHGKASAYLPVLDFLHGYFRIGADDDARTRREKVNGRIVTLDPALEDTRPYLFGLLGIVEGEDPLAQMDAQGKKRRTLDAIKRILLRESINQPLMVIFEDLHWIDEQTQEFLNMLADAIANARILLLVNYRPQYSHQWNSKTYYTQLRLDPLGKESADEMLAALLGDGAEIAQLKRVIIERTEGNPFFMEETVQVLLDEGALVRDGSSTRLTRPLGDLKIPPTVQGILAARIDRLSADAKDLLQAVAVIGREFPISLVRAVVATSGDELERLLNDLQLGEFIYEQPAVGDTEYAFKHALTQEVAYNSVLMERRRALHQRIGGALEALHANSLDDHLSELAHHYGRAKNPEKAVEYLYRAGQQAAMRSALGEAEDLLRQAIGTLGTMPETPARIEREFNLQMAYWQVLQYRRGFEFEEIAPTIRRLEELSQRIGTTESLIFADRAAFLWNFIRGDLNAAEKAADHMMETARRTGSTYGLTLANFDSGLAALRKGRIAVAKRHLEEVRISYKEADWKGSFVQPSAQALASIAIAHWHMGFADQGRAKILEAIAEADRLNSPTAQLYTLGHASFFHVLVREADRVRNYADRLVTVAGGAELASQRGSPYRGWAMVEAGRLEEGIETIRAGMEGTFGSAFFRSMWLRLLSEAYARNGQSEEAFDSIERAISASGDIAIDRPEAIRFRGELHLRSGDSSAAEADFHQAIALARQTGSNGYELRATMSMARLLRDTNCRDEARAMLAKIYNWFTEGIDTADLKDAKALLEELTP